MRPLSLLAAAAAATLLSVPADLQAQGPVRQTPGAAVTTFTDLHLVEYRVRDDRFIGRVSDAATGDDGLLEHARIAWFHHGGDELVYISSADWMPRNLDRRVELLVPVRDPRCRKRLTKILEANLADTCKARRILPDGGHERILPKKGREPAPVVDRPDRPPRDERCRHRRVGVQRPRLQALGCGRRSARPPSGRPDG